MMIWTGNARPALAVVCFFGVSLVSLPDALAQAEPNVSEGEAAAEPDEPDRDDARRSRRQRRRGIVLTAIGFSLASAGVTLSIFGFGEQLESGAEAMRPLAIVTLGLGLALTGVGLSDLIAGLLARRDENERASLVRLLASTMAPLRGLAPPSSVASSTSRVHVPLPI